MVDFAVLAKSSTTDVLVVVSICVADFVEVVVDVVLMVVVEVSLSEDNSTVLLVLVAGLLDFLVTNDDTVSVKSTVISEMSISSCPELSSVTLSATTNEEPSY